MLDRWLVDGFHGWLMLVLNVNGGKLMVGLWLIYCLRLKLVIYYDSNQVNQPQMCADPQKSPIV